MSINQTLVAKYAFLSAEELAWLEQLSIDLPVIADLGLGDAIVWVPMTDGRFLAIDHARPAGLITMFYRDISGHLLRDDWRVLVDAAMSTGEAQTSTAQFWYDEAPMGLAVYPICRRTEDGKTAPFAALSLHTSDAIIPRLTKVGNAYRHSAAKLLRMVAEGYFPDEATPSSSTGAVPRVSDGVMLIDDSGVVTFASPNTLTTFAKLGYRDELEGAVLSDVIRDILSGAKDTNESLPMIARAKIPKRADITWHGYTIAIRSIPIKKSGKQSGGLIMTRDVTNVRRHSQELLTKDATIREIHHRVKNNLQTVASLLRVQGRRADSEEAKQVLNQAMRRVSAIAVVHDTLASGIAQVVNFDELYDRVAGLAVEVASTPGTQASFARDGDFGQLPATYANSLALALTEIVTNAVEHGLAGTTGTVLTRVIRSDGQLEIEISDDGKGLVDGEVGDGLGTQIVRTLIEGELEGRITWCAGEKGGTLVRILVPLRFDAAGN